MSSSGARYDKNGQRLVTLTLAAAACLPLGAEPVLAQFSANCYQKMKFGQIADCAPAGGGRLTIAPTGAVNTGSGCFVLLGTPQPALCKAASFVTTGSIKISVTAAKVSMTGPGSNIKIDNLNIATPAGGNQKTYLSASLSATPLVFGIGGRMRTNPNQAMGAYSGKLTVKVIFTP